MLMAGQKMTKNKKSFQRYWMMCRELLGSLLFPTRCIVCDDILSPEESAKRIHAECESKLYPICGVVCMQCGRPIKKSFDAESEKSAYLEIYRSYEYCYECQPNIKSQRKSKITQSKALYLYKGAIKQTMYRFKYSNKREYAIYFAREAVCKYGAWMKEKQIQAIIPVPMYKYKERKRGYNQAKTFAKALSELTGVPVVEDMVIRVKDTRPLKSLNAVERKNNLKNAFQNGKSIVQYTHILVVDDIYTTGSTAQAVAEELIKQGVSHVYFMSICIGETM